MQPLLKCLVGVSLLGALNVVSAAPILLGTATMNGANESPGTGSPATGFAALFLDGNLLSVSLIFSGLTGGNAAAAHIHCCTAQGTNTGVTIPFGGFPAAAAGSYSSTFDLTSTSVYTAAFLTANGGTAASAQAALLAGIAAGRAYVNIHDATFPGGEIRGFVTPEPTSVLLLAPGLLGILWRRRKLARQA